MRAESRVLDTYSNPKYVVQVGDYHGVILIEYTPGKKYESFIDLTLFKDDKFFVTFFAKMKYNESYTIAESKFGYNDEASAKAKHYYRDTPFFEVPEKFSSFMPIRIEIFFDLVKKTLKEGSWIKQGQGWLLKGGSRGCGSGTQHAERRMNSGYTAG